MEVLTTGRPRFIPSDHLTAGATATMTRSHSRPQQAYNGQSSPQSVGGGSADTSIRDKTKLLQLAEKVHTRKSASPNYTKSFRSAISSAVIPKNSNKDDGGVMTTPTVRRANSTMLSSSLASSTASPHTPLQRSKQENYKNPKLYASFSSKSSSKLTKALIKSDPAKTNIEHLVNYKSSPSPPKGGNETHHSNSVNGKKSPSDPNGDHNNHGSSGGVGLSTFITPLKALHASFHERSSKLGQTRSKLFSHHQQHQRDISSSNAKLLFGTQENLHNISSSSGTSSSSSSSEDILSTEIISPSKTSKSSKASLGNNKSSLKDQKHNNKRAIINNNKNVTSSSTAALSSTSKIREQLGRQNGSTPVPPDFLEGFRNENGCNNRTTNQSNTTAPTNGYHHATPNKINGLDREQLGHEQQISTANNPTSANSFITPDILGGCIDVQSGYQRNGENNHQQQQVLVNGKNYYSMNGDSTVTTNGQPAQQHFSHDSNSQKRKNIVVRMSYHNENDDNIDNIEGDLYFGGNTIENGNVWPTSPITVSTVTPKSKQIVATKTMTRTSDNSSISSHPVTNNYCGKNDYDDEDILSEANGTVNTSSCKNDSVVSNSLFAGNSLSTFRPRPNNTKAGGGVASGRRSTLLAELPQTSRQKAASSSTLSNFVLKKSSDELKRKTQLTQNGGGLSSSGRLGQQERLSPRSSKQGVEEDQTQSHSPATTTGSSAWLQLKNSSSSPSLASEEGRIPQNNANENDINSKTSYFNGVGFKKENLKRAVASTALGPTLPRSNGTGKGGSSLQNLKGNRHSHDDTDNDSIINGYEGIDEFSVIVSKTDKGEDERGKSRGGLCVEAETSLRPPPLPQRRTGSGRPQTALLSDEYAQYLGYDYDNNLNEEGNDKVQQQGNHRLHVLQLGKNANESSSVMINPSSPSSTVQNKSDEDGQEDDESRNGTTVNNMTMLAITTNAAENVGHKRQNGIHGIMKPQQGKRHGGSKPIMHSVSFRGTTDFPSSRRGEFDEIHENYILEEEDDEKISNSRVYKLGLSESFNKFDRKKSRSLPKSFMSMRNGLRNVLPSQWVRDGLAFERLNDHENTSPEEKKQVNTSEAQGEEDLSEEALKMRWHKIGSSSSSSFSDRRPKSFDYAQRKAWMKLYRDMEVSQAASGSSSHSRISRPISKGSITHLHLQEAPSETTQSSSNLDGVDEACGCDYDAASLSAMMRSTDISSTSPSLFKRFSKTFSLRFGSGSNVSKNTGDVHQHQRKTKSKGAIGSSPDLYNRVEVDGSRDKVNGKMRKTNVKSVRGDKCQSGDSGIGMDEQQTEPRQVSNLRRIRSDYISPAVAAAAAIGASQSNPSYASRHHANGSTSTLAKLSLVEIPDHSWDENNGGSSPNEGSGSHTSDTTSYEDLVDAKLDGDDGFSSSDEGHPHSSEQLENPTYYHSLPHRKHKRRLKETESTNSCGEAPQEDNSIRGKVVREIIHTEQNYVKTLNDIVQGFLNPCRARNDLFSSRTVQNIFSNIEEILRLHVKFLEALKSKVDPTFVSKSNVGSVFTSWADKFSLYSEYCCNNPISVATVRSLVQFPQYAEFFEACRRLQMMDKLPLHGFLLRPIQRICQYHLQLNELLKHTEESHTDHQYVVEALETMKSVANKINDTQRQFESLQEIIRFQNSIDGWEGPSLVDRNAVILRKGELVKVTHGRKHKEVFVAILNKDLIYCKKDFMKKSGYVFDGRIDLNLRMWINIDSNEEDEFFGMVHNSWRIYSPERRAWILFTAPSPTEKRKWISALEKTKEDIFIDPKLREMAVVTTALTDSEMMSNGNSYGHHSNTLPKSSKKSKGKHLTVTKVDSDAMLIEVGKLKRSTVYQTSNSKEGTSKFYV